VGPGLFWEGSSISYTCMNVCASAHTTCLCARGGKSIKVDHVAILVYKATQIKIIFVKYTRVWHSVQVLILHRIAIAQVANDRVYLWYVLQALGTVYIAGNFRMVLIFVYFVCSFPYTKIKTTKIYY
jgi:hypothetical protein